MKKVLHSTKTILLIVVSVCLFHGISIGQVINNPVNMPGIQGNATIKATVNFSDLVAYDVAHPEIRANQKSPKEIEFNHGDIIEKMHGKDMPQGNHSMKSSHHEKYVLPNSPAPVTTFDEIGRASCRERV